MGRNAAIKRYDLTPEGQPMTLLDLREGRLPVIREILKSPWVRRASEIEYVANESSSAWACRRVHDPIEVVWDPSARRPATFTRIGRTYTVDAVLQRWSIETRWWDRHNRVSRRVWRVLSRNGVYDLAYDRLERSWLLLGIQD